jgi:peroxiredoxin
MNRVFPFLSSLILAAGLWSCQSGETVTSPSGTIISGTFNGVKGGEIIVLEALNSRSIEPVDTIVPDMDGKFSIGPDIQRPGFYRFFMSNRNFCNLIIGPNDTLTFTADINDLESSYEVSGSDESAKLKEFNDLMNAYVAKMDSINQLMQNAQMNGDQNAYMALYNTQMQLNASTGEQVRRFADTNSDYLASISAIQKLDPEQDMALYEKVLKGVKPKLAGTDLYKDFEMRIESIKRLQPGSELPDIALPGADEKVIHLKDVRGKLTLIDFWASWCKPCRAENPNVVATYKKFKNQGFEVVGISLDKNRDQWLAAIQDDGLNWTQMSDLRAWGSAACKTYNVTSIPTNFLIDENGVILAKNLRGEALPAKVGELLK